MYAKSLAIVSMCVFESLVLAGDGPQEGANARTVRTVNVIAQVPGVIEYVGDAKKPLAVGDRVVKGQVVVQLEDVRSRMDRLAKRVDPKRVKAAQLLQRHSESRLVVAKYHFELGTIGRADLDAARLVYNKHRDEAAALQKALELAQASPKEGPTPLERAELAVEMHRLRSPVNGVVRAIYKTRGEGVKSSEAILLIE